MKNLNFLKKKGSDKFFLENKNYFKNNIMNENISNLIKNNRIQANHILEIGCANGNNLNQYSKLCNTKKSYGVDLSRKAIINGKKKFINLKLLNISSIEINKIKIDFDLIICGFFLYQLDRELIFKQFDLIHKKLSNDGLLIIDDFDPLFKHTNKNHNNRNVKSFKMSYDNFLLESGLFEIVYKYKYNIVSEKKFKSENASLTLFRKIDFEKKYPENL